MFDKTSIDHHIQKHIMSVLTKNKFARFSDMKPRDVDSNLYAYHLKLLLRKRFVEKLIKVTG